MHGQLRESVKRRARVRENIGAILGLLALLFLIVLADRAGLPRKWRTPAYGTVIPFGITVTYSPNHWRRWAFWLSAAICLGVHTALLWSLFQYIFIWTYPGTLIWTPVVFIDVFVVFAAVMRLEQILIGKSSDAGARSVGKKKRWD